MMNGTLQTIDGRPALRFERRLDHSIERVWRAVTEPGGACPLVRRRGAVDARGRRGARSLSKNRRWVVAGRADSLTGS